MSIVLTLKLGCELNEASYEICAPTADKLEDALRKYLHELADDDLFGARIVVAYKEYRRILRVDEATWVVETVENGVGEQRPYKSRDKAIEGFIQCCLREGDHLTYEDGTEAERLEARLQEELGKSAALREELTQTRVQAAGVLTAIDGHRSECKQGDYGWSPAYDAACELRAKYEAAVVQRDELIRLLRRFAAKAYQAGDGERLALLPHDMVKLRAALSVCRGEAEDGS